MPDRLRLVVFDVDGTLVDSKAHILDAMETAFNRLGLAVPSRDAILHGVGLSLPELMTQLVPAQPDDVRHALADGYKSASLARHASSGHEHKAVFFPGIRDLLDQLRTDDLTLMATATGMSRRGLDRIIAQHGLHGYFQSMQVADTHPSKPHPSMLYAALADTGVLPGDAVMIGDTSYDMVMAKAAGVHAIGVTWGNHTEDHLADADRIVNTTHELSAILGQWIEDRT